MAIDPSTGSIYRHQGICSFRSTLHGREQPTAMYWYFPIPCPGYNGTSHKKHSGQCSSKIANSGRLVYQTRALGSQAVWDGHNYKARKYYGGVYLVLVKNNDGTEHIVQNRDGELK